MRLNWLFLKADDKKKFNNREYAFDCQNTVRFVNRIPGRSTRCPPRIVIYFGTNSLKTGRAIEDVVNDVMNGLHTHLEHCTSPTLFVNHNERYNTNSCHAGSSYVPTTLAKGSSIAIRNLALLTPTLYVHVCEGAHSGQRADFAVDWLARALPLLNAINTDVCDVYVCHAASPEEVEKALAHPTRSDTTLPVLSSIDGWDARKRKYTPYLLVPWSKAQWWV